MKRSLKAALLSALVFPGVGHFILKKYLSGLVIASTAFWGIYIVSSKIFEQAQQVVDKIQTGEIPLDVAAISQALTKQSMGADAEQMNMAATVIIIAWLVGIIDAYRQGYIEDKKNESTVQVDEL